MTEHTDKGSVTLTREEFDALISGIANISKRELTIRLDIQSENPAAHSLQSAINGLVDELDQVLSDDRDATMSMALSMSECFAVLDRVRQGNLDARISDESINTSDDLMRQFATTLNATIADIESQIETIQRQQNTQVAMEHLVRQLQTPILQLWDDVLALPVIGAIDSRRSQDMMETLLQEIIRHRSKYVIIDITGVEIVDTRTADHFVKVMKSAELLGTRCVMTGIHPSVAQKLVELGVDLSSIRTLSSLEEGLRDCLRDMDARKTYR